MIARSAQSFTTINEARKVPKSLYFLSFIHLVGSFPRNSVEISYLLKKWVENRSAHHNAETCYACQNYVKRLNSNHLKAKNNAKINKYIATFCASLPVERLPGENAPEPPSPGVQSTSTALMLIHMTMIMCPISKLLKCER